MDERGFFEKRKEQIFELCIFSFFLLLGFYMASENGFWMVPSIKWNAVFKDILFASGVISLLDSVYLLGLAKAIREVIKYKRYDFSNVNIAGISFAILFIIISLLLEIDDPSADLDVRVWSGTNAGLKFVEAGFIYLATRLHYLAMARPNPHEEVQLLERENAKLKQSMSIGLAEGYIYNFLERHIESLRKSTSKNFLFSSLKLVRKRRIGFQKNMAISKH